MVKLRRFLLIFVALAGFLIGLSLPLPQAQADFQSDYQGFLKTYDTYRTAHANYVTTRNQYLTYGTLASKNEALTNIKAFLVARDDVLLSYIGLLRQRTNDAGLNGLMDEEYDYLQGRKQVITAVASLEDAVEVAKEAEERHIPFQITSRKIVGGTISGNIDGLKLQFVLLEQEANLLIQNLRGQGRDTSTLERWLLDAQNKKLLTEQKLSQVRIQLDSLRALGADELTEEYNKVQFALFEANQYLREAIGFMTELSEAIKYGRF